MTDPKRILIVDDDDDFRASVEVLLRDRGYAVATAGVAPRIALSDAQSPHALTLDGVWEADGVVFLRHRRLRS